MFAKMPLSLKLPLFLNDVLRQALRVLRSTFVPGTSAPRQGQQPFKQALKALPPGAPFQIRAPALVASMALQYKAKEPPLGGGTGHLTRQIPNYATRDIRNLRKEFVHSTSWRQEDYSILPAKRKSL